MHPCDANVNPCDAFHQALSHIIMDNYRLYTLQKRKSLQFLKYEENAVNFKKLCIYMTINYVVFVK